MHFLHSFVSMQGETSLTNGMDTVFVRIPRHTDLQEYHCTMSPTQGEGTAAYGRGLDRAVVIRVSVHDGTYDLIVYYIICIWPAFDSFLSPCQLVLITFTHTNHMMQLIIII